MSPKVPGDARPNKMPAAREAPHECDNPGCQWRGYRPKVGAYIASLLATHPQQPALSKPGAKEGE